MKHLHILILKGDQTLFMELPIKLHIDAEFTTTIQNQSGSKTKTFKIFRYDTIGKLKDCPGEEIPVGIEMEPK